MIEISGLTKTFGQTRALSDVGFVAPPGTVTGLLGPNGAGKTTTLRILLGLARPDAGAATIAGAPYADLPSPRRTVGAVLDEAGFHPGRTGRNHLRVVARAAGISAARVDEVLDFVELAGAAGRRVGGYSHGMRQRLALAGALLGDPAVLVLDEPGTGLDPAGIAWLRHQMLDWAAQERTVLFSSHVLAEVEAVADRIVIIDRGVVVAAGSAAQLAPAQSGVLVRTPDLARLDAVATGEGWRVSRDGRDSLVILGPSAAEVGRVAAREGIALVELSAAAPAHRLEELFLGLTQTPERS